MKHNLNDKIFFDGVVEDRMDPNKLGRVRVRFFGIHTENKDLIPTEDLPWASVVYPNQTAPLISPLKEGSWVVGYFSDEELQYPVIIGMVPGVYESTPNKKFGFSDPAENLPDRPKTISSRTLNEDGTGSSFADDLAKSNSRQDIHDVNDYARNDETEIIDHRKETVAEEIPSAAQELGADGEEIWAEPLTPYSAEYPWNHAVLYESGHLIEFDDTPGAERIHEFHRSGTFREIYPNGDKIQKTVNDDYEFIYKDKRQVVFGNKYSYTLGKTNELNTGLVVVHDKDSRIHTTEIDLTENVGGNLTKNTVGNFVNITDGKYGHQAPKLTLAGEVHLGADSISEDGSPNAPNEEPVVLGDKLVAFLESLIDWIDQHAHPTPAGPSGPPVLQKGLSAINTVPPKPQLKKLLSEIVKTQ